MRALYIVGCFIAGAIGTYLAGPLLLRDSGVVQIFITVYSVLAGFLVAVIAVLGDPALLPPGSWRHAENHRQAIEARLIRHSYLFALYLLTIGIIFVSTLVKDAPPSVVPDWVQEWLVYAYFWLGTSAFLLSLGLPRLLMGVQKARVDAEIERRRHEAGISQDSDD